MKKLMIAAAAAAMGGIVLADTQVYNYSLSLKTTTCKEGKVSANTYYTELLQMEKGDEIEYRAPASVKLDGVSWGCNCEEALAGTWGSRQLQNGDYAVYGLTFWNKKADAFLGGVYNGAEIAWDFVNRMGKKAADVELSFDITPSADATDANFELKLAGIGTIKDVGLVANGSDCESYIKSAKGNVAGYLNPDIGGCYFCDSLSCNVYDFCDCSNSYMDDTKTVAYGTWTMKYNASASKKLAKNVKITQAYTGFPKGIKDALVKAGE